MGTDLILARMFDESGHRELGDKVRAKIWRTVQPTHSEALEAQREAEDIPDEDVYDSSAVRRRPRRACTAYPRKLLEMAARLPSLRDEGRIQEAIGRGELEEDIMRIVAPRSHAAVADHFHAAPKRDESLPRERYDIERLIAVYMTQRVPAGGIRIPVINELRRLWALMSHV